MLLVAKNHWLLVAKFSFYSLQQVTRYSLQKIIHHSLKQSQVIKLGGSFFQYNLFPRAKKFKVVPSQRMKLKSVVSRTFSNATIYNWVKTNCSKSKKWVRSYQMSKLFFDLRQVTNSKRKLFGVILFKFKSCLNRRLSLKTIHLWPKMKELIALSQKNKQNRLLCPILQFQNLLENFNFYKVSLLYMCQWTQNKTNVVPLQPINDTCYTK